MVFDTKRRCDDDDNESKRANVDLKVIVICKAKININNKRALHTIVCLAIFTTVEVTS